jgi:transcriptional regulator with GAF, ATPase, and Fis domain
LKVHEIDFFREVTLRICSSLEIEKSLWQCFLYVKTVMPVDELILLVYHRHIGTLEVVATADVNGGVIRSIQVPIPHEGRKILENAAYFPHVRVLDNVHDDLIVGKVAKAVGWPPSSIIVNRLIFDEKMMGAFYVRNEGKGKYTKDHARLWSLTNRPLAIALANSQSHREVLEHRELLADDNAYLREELQLSSLGTIVGEDLNLKEVMKQVRRVASLESSVVLLGETGTGKEVMANAIHQLSRRRNGPFVKVNCAAIPDSLIDSELFGHEKGAFTGAYVQRRGRFEKAHRGTIFLDEIGELPLQAQAKLLRVLQEKTIERVGSSDTLRVDVRLISATNRDLEKMVQEGTLREDFYFRIKVFTIAIPPLRERKEDIPLLVTHFMSKMQKEMKLPSMPVIAQNVMDRLRQYSWPGNIRELQNAVERALILSGGRPLLFDDIPPSGTRVFHQEIVNPEDVSMINLKDVESRHIRAVLEKVGGRVEGKDGAAQLLGVNPSTLRHRMKKLGIAYGKNRLKIEQPLTYPGV